MSRDRYFFFCSSVPAISSGIAPSEFAGHRRVDAGAAERDLLLDEAVVEAAHAEAAVRLAGSRCSSGRCRSAFLQISSGTRRSRRDAPASGMISLRVKSRASSVRASCSSLRDRSNAMAWPYYQRFCFERSTRQ